MGGRYARGNWMTVPITNTLQMPGDDSRYAGEVLYRSAKPPADPSARYPGFRPGVTTLRKGAVIKPGARPLACDLVFEQDVAVTLRDGKVIFVDVLRPVGEVVVPALISWSPYGKQSGIIILDDIPERAGIPKEWLSGLEMFEGPDPSYWCSHGYAIVNVDARGAFQSEGDIRFWGRQDGEDGCDLIEWVAAQPWSNSKVGMTGNSWLAIAQWFIAAEQPPHLTAIAPWEGWTDLYRYDVIRGGIPDIGFNEHMIKLFSGNGQVEDIPAMVRKYSLMNAYWEDKIPRLANIRIPTYVVGSWTNLIHGMGTLTGYRQIESSDKWLRVHNKHEWTDYYENTDDLRRFFDCYLKGIDNGWKQTPRVRLSILNPGGKDSVNRPEAEFPLARTRYQFLHLDAARHLLSAEPVSQETRAGYVSDDPKDKLVFTYRFPAATELTGYLMLRLWVEACDADDLDVYVEVRKLFRSGRRALCRNITPPNPVVAWILEQLYRLGKAKFGMLFFSGAKGMLRASHRETDPEKSRTAEPFHLHRKVQKLRPGEIVPLDIQIWPLGMKWQAGEQLQLLIAGHKLSAAEMPGVAPPDTINKGRHVIHAGGQYDSYLVVPVIPELDAAQRSPTHHSQ